MSSAYDRVMDALEAFQQEHKVDLLDLALEDVKLDGGPSDMPDRFHRYSAMDTVYRAQEDFNHYVCKNPAVVQSGELSSQAWVINALLAKLYQVAGREFHDNEEAEDKKP